MSSASTMLRATAIALGVALICLIPPVVHFVTGPLAPAIGGYFAGTKTRLSHGQAAVLGLILGLVVGLPTPVAFSQTNVLPHFSPLVIIFFSVLAALYFGVLGGVAAAIGGHSARNES